MPINPGLKFCFVFVFYIPMHCLGWHFALLLLYLVVKDQQYFVTSSFMFLDEKNLLEILLNPGLNLTIFRETAPRGIRRSGNGRTPNDSEGLGNWVDEVSGLFFHQLNDPIYVEPNSLSFLTPITKLRVIRRSAFSLRSAKYTHPCRNLSWSRQTKSSAGKVCLSFDRGGLGRRHARG